MTLLSRTWRLGIALVLAAAAWSGYLWLRDVSLFQVRHVEVEGLEKGDSPAIRRALRQTAQRMTVLHVREGELEQAVDAFPVVRSLTASGDFPNTLHIEVNRQVPVARLTSPAGRRAVVAADGTLLPRVETGSLPAVRVKALPGGDTLEERPARALVGFLGAAPRQLRPLFGRAYIAADGIRIAVRQGPVLRFGGIHRSAAKWAAVTRVLADPSSKPADFVDVRSPERPVAGGFTPVAPEPETDAGATAAAPQDGSQPPVSAEPGVTAPPATNSQP
jgi:cell division protein FtsQ